MAAWRRNLIVWRAPKRGLLHGGARLMHGRTVCERYVSSSWKEVSLNELGDWCDRCVPLFNQEKKRIQNEVLDEQFRSSARQAEANNRKRLLAEITGPRRSVQPHPRCPCKKSKKSSECSSAKPRSNANPARPEGRRVAVSKAKAMPLRSANRAGRKPSVAPPRLPVPECRLGVHTSREECRLAKLNDVVCVRDCPYCGWMNRTSAGTPSVRCVKCSQWFDIPVGLRPR
jgi:hypothetical protein